MRLLNRYVMGELLKVFLVSLLGMTSFMLMVGVVQEAVRQSLGLPQIVMLLPYLVPEALRFAVPATILFSTCSVFGRLASSNEIVAIKSMGIHPWTVLWPTYVLAFCLSLVAVWLNDVAVSWGRSGARRVVIQSVEQIAYSMLTQNRSYSTKQFSINVKRVDGRRLVRPTISFQSTTDAPAVVLVAEEAELKSDLVANTLTIVCRNGTIDIGDVRAVFPDVLEREIPLDQASKKGVGKVSTSDVPLAEIAGERDTQLTRNQHLEQRIAARAAMAMMVGDHELLSSGLLSSEHGQLKDDRNRYYRLRMETQRRWANGFSCLFFVLIGAPVAIVRRNADFVTSFFVCFMPILLLYYPMLMLTVSQAKSGTFPTYLLWLGNLVLAAAGWYYQRKVVRY